MLAVPADAMPYTKHSSMKQTEYGHHITFHGMSRVRWTYNGKPVIDEDRNDVEYQFNDEAQYEAFQQDVRGQDLLDTFDAETVRVHRHSDWGVASGQDLKLWRSREADGAASISFFANSIQDHCEFPLDWIQRVFTADDEHARVELTFVRSPGGGGADADDAQTTVSRRRQFLRRWSGSSGSGSRSNVSLALPAAPTGSPSTASVAATSSSSIGSRSGPSLTHAQKMAKRARDFRYLRIEFLVPGEREKDTGERRLF